jgi:hypothetical protein
MSNLKPKFREWADLYHISRKQASKFYWQSYNKGKMAAQEISYVIFLKPSDGNCEGQKWMERVGYAEGFNAVMAKKAQMFHRDPQAQRSVPLFPPMGAIQQSVIKKECWEIETKDRVEILSSCGKIRTEPLVLGLEVMSKIRGLMEKFPKLEWLAYLREHDGVIDELWVPPQKVGAASVEVTDAGSSIDHGVIHSHNSMKAFFSGTDDDYLNNTYDFSIVTAFGDRDLEFAGVRKLKTECGGIVVAKTEVLEAVLSPDKVFSEEVAHLITEKYPFIGGANQQVRYTTQSEKSNFPKSEYLLDKEERFDMMTGIGSGEDRLWDEQMHNYGMVD